VAKRELRIDPIPYPSEIGDDDPMQPGPALEAWRAWVENSLHDLYERLNQQRARLRYVGERCAQEIDEIRQHVGLPAKDRRMR